MRPRFSNTWVSTFDTLPLCCFQLNKEFQCCVNHHILSLFTFYAPPGSLYSWKWVEGCNLNYGSLQLKWLNWYGRRAVSGRTVVLARVWVEAECSLEAWRRVGCQVSLWRIVTDGGASTKTAVLLSGAKQGGGLQCVTVTHNTLSS